jgi:hypothetical protein
MGCPVGTGRSARRGEEGLAATVGAGTHGDRASVVSVVGTVAPHNAEQPGPREAADPQRGQRASSGCAVSTLKAQRPRRRRRGEPWRAAALRPISRRASKPVAKSDVEAAPDRDEHSLTIKKPLDRARGAEPTRATKRGSSGASAEVSKLFPDSRPAGRPTAEAATESPANTALLVKPSWGLEPQTPSLPLRPRGCDCLWLLAISASDVSRERVRNAEFGTFLGHGLAGYRARGRRPSPRRQWPPMPLVSASYGITIWMYHDVIHHRWSPALPRALQRRRGVDRTRDARDLHRPPATASVFEPLRDPG